MLADVVRADDRRAALECRNGDADGCRRGTDLRAGQLAERALPRKADEDRPAERAELVEPANELEVVLGRLAKTDPGIEADELLAYSL